MQDAFQPVPDFISYAWRWELAAISWFGLPYPQVGASPCPAVLTSICFEPHAFCCLMYQTPFITKAGGGACLEMRLLYS